jgi:hypothetical protein
MATTIARRFFALRPFNSGANCRSTSVERLDDPGGVPVEVAQLSRVLSMSRQVESDNSQPSLPESGYHPVPAPGTEPCTVNEDDRVRHKATLRPTVVADRFWRIQLGSNSLALTSTIIAGLELTQDLLAQGSGVVRTTRLMSYPSQEVTTGQWSELVESTVL